MRMNLRLVLCVLVASALAGCANPFHDFYHQAPSVPDARMLPGAIPATGPVEVYTTTDMQKDVRAAQRRGYAVVGQSTFNSGGRGVSGDNLRKQAQDVGAQMVLISSSYTNTVNGAMPLVTPTSSTTFVSSSYGSATATTYGTTTTMVPFSVRRSDYTAVYFVRRKSLLGVYMRPANDEERQKLQSNSPLIVDIVIDNSPAFTADILPGDAVTSFAGQAPGTVPDLLQRIAAFQGQEVDIALVRGDQRLTKRVRLDRW
jgi:membrane-associated protease RseP (regulator of RpoE activity)